MSCFWHVLWPQLGGYCGRWTRTVPGWFRAKMACTGAAKELFDKLLRGSHAIAWLGSKLKPSGMQLRGFPRNYVAPAHLQTSKFEWL